MEGLKEYYWLMGAGVGLLTMLFLLYRLLVSGKDSTIESLKAKIDLLDRESGAAALNAQKGIADTYRERAELADKEKRELQAELDAASKPKLRE